MADIDPVKSSNQKQIKNLLNKTLISVQRQMQNNTNGNCNGRIPKPMHPLQFQGKCFGTNKTNTIVFASNLRNSSEPTAVVNKAGNLSNKGSNEFRSSNTETGDGDTCEKKLKIRGLKNFVEKHGNGIPPNWIKEFPIRSRFNPDVFIQSEEGPFSTKRNTEAMDKCLHKGGRCDKCGISTMNLCDGCRKCEWDCKCERKNSKTRNMLGLPSLDSYLPTLNHAQKMLHRSQNAPNVYPFTEDSEANKMDSRGVNLQYPNLNPPVYPPTYGYPMHPYAYPQPYPYMMPPPPLPYMMPPPMPYGYPPHPPPMVMGYPPSPYGSPSTYQSHSQPPQQQSSHTQPVSKTYVAFNTPDTP